MKNSATYRLINNIFGTVENPENSRQIKLIDLKSIDELINAGDLRTDDPIITLKSIIEEALQYSLHNEESRPHYEAILNAANIRLNELETELATWPEANENEDPLTSGNLQQQKNNLEQKICALRLLPENLALLSTRINQAQTQYQFLGGAMNSTTTLSPDTEDTEALIKKWLATLMIQYGSRLHLENDVKDRVRAESRNARARMSGKEFDELVRVISLPFMICAIVGFTSLVSGVYGLGGAFLCVPAFAVVVCGLAVLFRTIRDTKHDIQLRPWAAFAFIGLSALYFAGLGVGLFFMFHAISHAHLAGGTFLFGVLTALIIGFACILTELIKTGVNGIDSYIAQKNDSYSGIHSGCQIDEAKLKATCDSKDWDIDVTREALRTLVAQYDKNEKQIFPMTQTSYGRKTLNLFTSILNGKYLNKDNEPIITTVVDDVVQKFDLRGGKDYQFGMRP